MSEANVSVWDELERDAKNARIGEWESIQAAIAHGRALEAIADGAIATAKEFEAQITALEARVKELERESEKRAETIRLAFQADVEKKARIVKLEAENARIKREVEVLRQYGNKDCTAMADAVLAEKATERSEGTSEEIASLRRIRDAAAEWKEFTEKNGGDYLPGHAQRIYAALAAHEARFGEG